MKLVTLFVRYGDRDYYGAFKRLSDLYNHLGISNYDALIIDTALPKTVQVKIGNNISLIGGDNTRREFSGWNSALEKLSENLEDYDVVNIVTSAFENDYNGFYSKIGKDYFSYAADRPELVLSHIDAYPDAVRLFGRSFQTWGCSKFLICSPKRIRRLDSFVASFSVDDFFASSAESPFKIDAPLSNNYKGHLKSWLTGDGLPHGQWHSVFELSETSLEKFQAKAMSIIDEHTLSIRLRETGSKLVDYTWLHAHGLDLAPPNIPDEVTQVLERNIFLFGNGIITPAVDLKDYASNKDFDSFFQSNNAPPFSNISIIKPLWLGNRDLQQYLVVDNPVHCAAIHLNQDIPIAPKELKWLSETDQTIPQDCALPITRGLHAAYLSRDDLRASFDLSSPAGRRSLIRWWIEDGRFDTRYETFIEDSVYSIIDWTIPQDTPLPITIGLRCLLDAKEDLREAIDLSTAHGRNMLIQWWIREGMKSPEYDVFMPKSSYTELSTDVSQDTPLPITRGLHALLFAKEDLQQQIDLSTCNGRKDLVTWWISSGMRDPEISPFIEEDCYSKVSSQVSQDVGLPITSGLLALHASREDLSSLDMNSYSGRAQLISWWIDIGRFDPQYRQFMREEIYLESDPSLIQDASLPITRGMRSFLISRRDLHDSFDLKTQEDRQSFVNWWVYHALARPDLRHFIHPDAYEKPAPGIPQDVYLPITCGLFSLFNSRPDLADFDIETLAGRKSLINWWLKFGAMDQATAWLVPEHVYSEPVPGIPQDAGMPINRAMCAFYIADHNSEPDGNFTFSTLEKRKSLVKWWCRKFLSRTLRLPFTLTREMVITSIDAEQGDIDSVHPLALEAWHIRDDLQQAFDISNSDGRIALNNWLHDFGLREMGYTEKDSIPSLKDKSYDAPFCGSYKSNGVNLIGFGRGELGIGEDVRMAALSLSKTDVDYCVPSIPLRIGARQCDLTLQHYETELPIYNTNLIFLPHYETVRLLGAAGNKILGNRYNIGCWQWELPRYPKGLELAVDVVDEVWSSTKFIADAMRSSTNKPVYVMPMAVKLPYVHSVYEYHEFALPNNEEFKFLNVLDGNSSIARKNPLAVAKAFQIAFPKKVNGIRLIFKAMNITSTDDEWLGVLKIAEADSRITIISEAFPREKLIALQALADCFVSLHRAEGFGRNIAEAMLLGKTVITSNYSGNTDFTNSSTALLVEGSIVPVRKDQYSFADGQHWFEADLESAATMMRICYEDAIRRKEIARNGQEFIRDNYSPEAVSHRYYERLKSLELFNGVG